MLRCFRRERRSRRRRQQTDVGAEKERCVIVEPLIIAGDLVALARLPRHAGRDARGAILGPAWPARIGEVAIRQGIRIGERAGLELILTNVLIGEVEPELVAADRTTDTRI